MDKGCDETVLEIIAEGVNEFRDALVVNGGNPLLVDAAGVCVVVVLVVVMSVLVYWEQNSLKAVGTKVLIAEYPTVVPQELERSDKSTEFELLVSRMQAQFQSVQLRAGRSAESIADATQLPKLKIAEKFAGSVCAMILEMRR